MDNKIEVSKKEASYLQKRIDFGIDTGKKFFGFIQFQIKEGSSPGSALKVINYMKKCKNGDAVSVSTSTNRKSY